MGKSCLCKTSWGCSLKKKIRKVHSRCAGVLIDIAFSSTLQTPMYFSGENDSSLKKIGNKQYRSIVSSTIAMKAIKAPHFLDFTDWMRLKMGLTSGSQTVGQDWLVGHNLMFDGLPKGEERSDNSWPQGYSKIKSSKNLGLRAFYKTSKYF